MSSHRITSVDDLIEALGGDTVVASEFDISQPAVAAWKIRKDIPGGWHLRLWAWAKREGLTVDPKVFGLTKREANDLFGSQNHNGQSAEERAA